MIIYKHANEIRKKQIMMTSPCQVLAASDRKEGIAATDCQEDWPSTSMSQQKGTDHLKVDDPSVV